MSSDFSPEVRNAYWWSGDSRKATNGKANEVILTKLGQMPIPDLSDVEAVQMGHVMEPVIGRLAQARLGLELEKLEAWKAHSSEPWMRSHFDFVGEQDGETVLVEAKNYGQHRRKEFDVEAGVMPSADYAQLVHEAAVFGCRTVYLAVLFGGQEFVTIRKEVSDQEKEELIKTMSAYWACVKLKQPLPPEDSDQARIMFPQSRGSARTAPQAVEVAAAHLKTIKAQIKALEAQEESYTTMIQGSMEDDDTLVSVTGEVLATWKSAKASRKFDAKLFQSAMPDIYEQFVREMPGSRRFLVK